MEPNVAAMLRLMFVTDDRLLAGRDVVEVAQAAVRGGATSVQLRLKLAAPRELLAAARALVERLPVPLIVNDRLDVALAAGAAGVHLGPDDLPVRLARRAAPAGFIVGASVGGEWELAGGEGADYWGVGPWRVTGTKSDAGLPLGAAGFRAIVARSGGVPCVAIGGVTPEDVPDVFAAGGAGVAVVSGILGAPDPVAAARCYRERITLAAPATSSTTVSGPRPSGNASPAP